MSSSSATAAASSAYSGELRAPPRPRRSCGSSRRDPAPVVGRPCRQDRRVAPDVLLHLIEPAALAGRPGRRRGAAAVAGRRWGSCTSPRPSRCTCRRSGSTPAGATWCCWWSIPARLTDPVRFEAGRAGRSRAGCCSRTSTARCRCRAVVAVVPYRPPAPLALPAAGRPARPRPGVLHVAADPPGRRRGRRARRGRGARPGLRALPGQQPAAVHRTGGRRHGGGARPRRWRATPAGRTGRRRCCGPDADDVAAELGGRGLEHRGAAADGPPGRRRPRAASAPRWWTQQRGARVLGAVLAARPARPARTGTGWWPT